MRAADLFEQDVIPAEIARQVGVSHQIVSDWRTVWRQYGRDGLRGAGRAGRRPKLGAEQLDQVGAALANGPEANGYTTDLRTLRRVAEVIEQVSGVVWGGKTSDVLRRRDRRRGVVRSTPDAIGHCQWLDGPSPEGSAIQAYDAAAPGCNTGRTRSPRTEHAARPRK
jgi:transposase